MIAQYPLVTLNKKSTNERCLVDLKFTCLLRAFGLLRIIPLSKSYRYLTTAPQLYIVKVCQKNDRLLEANEGTFLPMEKFTQMIFHCINCGHSKIFRESMEKVLHKFF